MCLFSLLSVLSLHSSHASGDQCGQGFRVAGVVVSAQGVQKMLGAYIMLCVYLFTLQVRLAAFTFRYEPHCACVRAATL